MATENLTINDNDGSPLQEVTKTPSARHSFSEQHNSAPVLHSRSDGNIISNPSLPTGADTASYNDKQCWVCKKKFGMIECLRFCVFMNI